MSEISIKLKHKETGKTKQIKKVEGYPIEIGDTILFSKYNDFDDLWEVIDIKKEATK